ncbi:MAG TPA: CBS domain-containing protein [Candidatus Binatia bacterium]|nr:CBS domain-containing protein [Candidatus Binatia bacterium]
MARQRKQAKKPAEKTRARKRPAVKPSARKRRPARRAAPRAGGGGRAGGAGGRVDETGHSGVYPASGPLPKGEAPIRTMAAWGQGERGAAGYEDAGQSEIVHTEPSTPAPAQITARAGAAGRRTVRDVMTPDPTCCAPDDTVQHAARIMKDEDVGAVPVVDEERRPVGIVTDRDLALEVVAQSEDARRVTVESVMTPSPVTVRPDDEVDAVLAAMGEHQVRRVPVVDPEGRIVGIVAQADLATRLDASTETAEAVRAISEPPGR